MVKQVPLTTELSQTLDAGSAVQFTGGQVDPMENKMPGQIRKQSTAMLQMQKASQALADQLNDAEATKLYNEFAPELENNHNAYTELEGFDAVAPIQPDEEGGEWGNTLDVYKNTNLKNLKEKYLEKASNGSVKFMFEAKAHQAIADSQNKMIQHSIQQQRIGAVTALSDHLTITKRQTIDDYENYDKEGSVYQTRKYVGMALIDEIALANGWNIDATKGRVSSQYLQLRSAYLYEIGTGVIEMMNEKLPDHKKNEAIRKYINTYRSDLGEKTTDNLLEINEKEGKLHKLSACVDATLRDNGNINDGSFISAANRMYCLSSSNSFDNGKGVSTNQGLHSDKVNTDETTISENMEFAEQLINTESKFYKPDSELNGTLINQHKPIHMFAALHLGVEKADSLYTKAKSQVDIDSKQFKNNPVYAKNINSQIITNYKKLIIEEANEEFRPEIVRIEKEIKKLEEQKKKFKGMGGEGVKRNKITKKITQLNNQLEIQKKTEDPGFADKVVNDLNILEGEIDYDYDPQITAELKIDKVSNLQPLSVLEQKLRATVKDEKELEVALKDLRIKHRDITNSSNEVYTQNLKKAKIISWSREGGYNDLAANGININDFKEEDQKILRDGQPEKSDTDTLIMLERNPEQLKDNLNKYDYRLNKKDFLALEDYAAKLNTPGTVLEARGNSDMFDASLIRFGYTDIVSKVTDDPKAKDQYNFKFDYKQIKDAWLNRIDKEQSDTGKKLTRTRKQELLDEILADGVITKSYGLFRNKFITIPSVALEADQFEDAFVFVDGKKIFSKRIPKDVREYFIAGYEAAGIPYTEQMIANEYVLHGKKKSKEEIIKFKEENNL